MLVCVRLRHVAGTQWGNKKYMNMKHLEAAVEDASIAGCLHSFQSLQTILCKILDTTMADTEKRRQAEAYQFLQPAADSFLRTHVKAAGFTDFERGIEGSTAEHLVCWNTRLNGTGRLCRSFSRKSETWVHRRKKPERSGMSCTARL